MGFEQMLRRRQINADPGARGLRSLPAAFDVVRWPFERLHWALERRLVWPLQERVAGWRPHAPDWPLRPPGSTAGAVALSAVALAAIGIGTFWLSASDGGKPVAEPARVAIATPPEPQPEPSQHRTLQGAAPSFGVSPAAGVAEGPDGAAAGDPAEVEASAAAPQPEGAAGATSSSRKPVPAGPAAMKVARRFAEAFVFYEIGERPARAKAVFGETTTPQLAAALAERPPRLPQDGEVPKARVLNLVPGPRAGKAYTVSVSLLRVGLTTELRLEMRKSDAWRVTDVRG